MKRRTLLVIGAAWLAAAATRSFAQTSKAPRRIALVHPGTAAGLRSDFEAFRAALKKLGYVEGKDISIEARWAEGRTERLESLAAETVALNPEVILTGSSAGVAACRKATASIPIVFTTAGNVVEQGFVSSLRRPGGNVTGIVLHPGLHAKLVEIARDAFPKARRLAILVHDTDPFHKTVLDAFEPAALHFKFDPVIVRIARADEIGRAFIELAQRKAEVLLVPALATLNSLRQELVERSRKARLPLLSIFPLFAESGGLLSYGTRSDENWRRAAALVDKILRGAKPGDLPVEQPERFELVVNLKTAKEIGVSLSSLFLQRADKVIE